MRDRLVALIDAARSENAFDIVFADIDELIDMPRGVEALADHLLANGVIVPPCKAGDTVYYINRYNHIMLYRDRVYEAVVARIVVTKYGVSYVIRIHGGHAVNEIPDVEFGKNVFLTREEAEQALLKP